MLTVALDVNKKVVTVHVAQECDRVFFQNTDAICVDNGSFCCITLRGFVWLAQSQRGKTPRRRAVCESDYYLRAEKAHRKLGFAASISTKQSKRHETNRKSGWTLSISRSLHWTAFERFDFCFCTERLARNIAVIIVLYAKCVAIRFLVCEYNYLIMTRVPVCTVCLQTE